MYERNTSLILDRREMLRIKLKSLMEEARIIRREESKTNGPLREELTIHRREVVRDEARHTHLAYGFIRGLTFDQMERTQRSLPDWNRVRAMTKKYGPKNFTEPECMKPKT